MAFFSVILLNFIFWILLGIFVIGAAAFLVSIIFAVLYLKSRKRPDRFLQAGADLSAENGMGKNSEAYLQSLLDQSTVPKEQADKILALLRQ